MARVKNELEFLNESLSARVNTLAELSKKCLQAKQALWEVEAQKLYLQSKSSSISTTWDSESCLNELREKYETFKGTSIEKVLFGLIRAYQQYKNHTVALSVLVQEKEELLSKYKKITSSLSQETNLNAKLRSLHEYLGEKEKNTSFLKENLVMLRNQHLKLKDSLLNGPVSKCFQELEQVKTEIKKISENCRFLQFEIESLDQVILTEKACSKPEEIQKALRNRVKEKELEIAEVLRKIKEKERKSNRLKISLNKSRKSEVVSPNRSVKSIQSSTPKSRSMAISPDFQGGKQNERCQVIRYLRNGIDHKNSAKITKVFNQIGSESQSFTSKIVMLNRGSYFS
jgi:hypothetical protein